MTGSSAAIEHGRAAETAACEFSLWLLTEAMRDDSDRDTDLERVRRLLREQLRADGIDTAVLAAALADFREQVLAAAACLAPDGLPTSGRLRPRGGRAQTWRTDSPVLVCMPGGLEEGGV